MARTFRLDRAIEDETKCRRAFIRWLGERTVKEAGELLGRSPSWMSMWLHHRVELRDDELDRWSESVGVSVRTFMEGRFDSRARFGVTVGDAAA